MINNKVIDQRKYCDNLDGKIEDMHGNNKDPEDDILYVTYTNVDSF